jgi:polysaccharide biosynthesis protein PslG
VGRPSGLRGPARGLPVALLIIIGGLAVGWPLHSIAAAGAPAGFFGVNAQPLFAATGDDWGLQLTAMQAGGIEIVRADARWDEIQPEPGSYDWSGCDAMVLALAQHGLRWYPVLDDAPAWAAQGPNDPSPAAAHEQDFATFAAALAGRYGPGGSFWDAHPSLVPLPVTDYEIWNEENSTAFWPSQADAPERYADLYALARSAIRAVDPQARVVIGGLALVNPPLAEDEVGFLRAMLAHRPDLVGQVDGVGLHPYQPTLFYLYQRLAAFRQAVNQLLGPSAPIDITEVGWPSTATAEPDRATYLTALATQLPRSDCNVDKLIVYSWTAAERAPTEAEEWFGIWNLDGSPKPAGLAYTQAVLSMRGLSARQPPSGTIRLCSPPPPPAAPGPSLRLRVVVNQSARHVTAFARCPAGCALDLALMGRRHGTLKPLTHRSTRFARRERRFRMRYHRGTRALRLEVVARGAAGTRTMRRVTLAMGRTRR